MHNNRRRREPLSTILASQPLSAQVAGVRGTVHGSDGWHKGCGRWLSDQLTMGEPAVDGDGHGRTVETVQAPVPTGQKRVTLADKDAVGGSSPADLTWSSSGRRSLTVAASSTANLLSVSNRFMASIIIATT